MWQVAELCLLSYGNFKTNTASLKVLVFNQQVYHEFVKQNLKQEV